ncbi:MAG: DsrE family protein [Phycisphaerae bacterium]|jgi:uncharacterized protein involved in oxidation of intracellular sulfur
MKIGIVINTNDEEKAFNAFRFGNYSMKKCHEVKVFLMGKAVEIDSKDYKKFDVKGQASEFIRNNGIIHACGSCLKLRQKESSNICPISTMQDLLNIVEQSDKVISFG